MIDLMTHDLQRLVKQGQVGQFFPFWFALLMYLLSSEATILLSTKFGYKIDGCWDDTLVPAPEVDGPVGVDDLDDVPILDPSLEVRGSKHNESWYNCSSSKWWDVSKR